MSSVSVGTESPNLTVRTQRCRTGGSIFHVTCSALAVADQIRKSVETGRTMRLATNLSVHITCFPALEIDHHCSPPSRTIKDAQDDQIQSHMLQKDNCGQNNFKRTIILKVVAAWQRDTAGWPKCVFAATARQKGADERRMGRRHQAAWPSLERIATDLNMHKSTVVRSVYLLRERDWISVKHRSGCSDMNSRRFIRSPRPRGRATTAAL
jgi:hypothetical protein